MSVNNLVKRLQNEMRGDAGINGDAQRIEQMVWMFFLKVYDAQEEIWECTKDKYKSIIPEKMRWRNWAVDEKDGKALTGDALLAFVNNELFPTLKNLPVNENTPRGKAIVRMVFEDLNQYMKDGIILRKLINIIDEVDFSDADDRHTFGDIYEGILKDLQSAGNAGEFYTPRALTDFIVQQLHPKLGETFGDFTSGTGGFLTSCLNYLKPSVKTTSDEKKFQSSIVGQEWKPLPYLLSITNMLVHDIEEPNITHTDSLGRKVTEFKDSDKVDCIGMNPPYGGSTGMNAKLNFPTSMQSSETADLFIVLIMYRLKKMGRAGVIIPDGFLFGTDGAKLAIKQKLLREFNLHTVIRLPGSIFSPYTSIATNILFFDNEKAKGAPTGFSTKETWFYRLDMPEGYKHFSKTKPMRLEHCKPIMDWWNNREEILETNDDGEVVSEKSRKFTPEELVEMECNFDQCKFPKEEEEVLPPAELFSLFHEKSEKYLDDIFGVISNLQTILNGEKTSKKNVDSKSFYKYSELIKSIPETLKKSFLQEAIQGKLVPQNPKDEPASVLLAKIRKEKEALVKQGKLKKKDLEITPIDDDEIPFEIPDSWTWCRLGDIVSKLVDGDHNPPSGIAKKTEYMMLSSRNINFDKLVDLDNVRYLDADVFAKENERTNATIGDVLFTSVGTIGRSCVLKEDVNICFQRSVTIMTTYVYNEYLKRYFDSPFYQNYADEHAVGTAQRGFYLKEMEQSLIALPPLAEQKRIVAKLEQLFKVL